MMNEFQKDTDRFSVHHAFLGKLKEQGLNLPQFRFETGSTTEAEISFETAHIMSLK
jgi:hypothetical protein